MNRILSLFIVSLFISAAALPLQAQDRKDKDDSMLPEIDPQDIEIRSQFKARFPGLRRQPILGFEPASRIYKVDPNRLPYMEDRDDAVANVPVSQMSRPAPPGFASMQYSPEINAFARAGLGSYTSPEVNFWGVTRPNDKSYIGGDLDFSSSDGHLENQQSSFRFLRANGEFATKLDKKTRLALDLGLQNSFNHMYSLDSFDSPRKEYGGFNLGGEVERIKNGAAGWTLEVGARYYQVELMEGPLPGKTEEGVYNASFSKVWALANPSETITAKLGGKLGDYSNSINADQWKTGRVGVIYNRLFNYETHITVDASVYYGSNAFEEKAYFGPTVTVEQPIFEGAVLTAEVGAKPYVQSAEELHGTNRFLNVQNSYLHSYRKYGSASLKLNYSEVGSLTGGFKYEDMTNRPIFMRESGADSYYSVRYRDATNIKLFAGATHQFVPEKFWLHGQLYAQNPSLKDDGRVPFTEKLGFNAGFGLQLIEWATIEGWADYVGERENTNGESLENYVLLGGQLNLEITDNIGAYAKAVNLLDQQYQKWDGYTERPLQIYGGITLKL